MIDIGNILRLAGDGYDARDIRQFTRIPIPAIRQICKEHGVELHAVTERPRPVIALVSNPQSEAHIRYEVKMAAKYSQPQKDPAPPKTRENSLAAARAWLGKRLVDKPGVGYFLDGTPVNLDGMMRETYRLMIAAGVQPNIVNPNWRPV